MIHTIQSIRALLHSNPRAVEVALVRLLERQTADEQTDHEVKHLNSAGFAVVTRKRGQYMAEWILSGRHLTGYWKRAGLSIACYHAKQLAALANSKEIDKSEAKRESHKEAMNRGFVTEIDEQELDARLAEQEQASRDEQAWEDAADAARREAEVQEYETRPRYGVTGGRVSA